LEEENESHGTMKIRIDVEKSMLFYRKNMKWILQAAMLGNEGAIRIKELADVAIDDETDENLASFCLALEEYRRCWYQ